MSTPSESAAPAPLAPPEATLTLTAPEAPAVVAETQAPRMAPQVPAEVVPELDAKVEGFLTALSATTVGSPEFSAQAENVRTMGDADIRKAAETSNRMLDKPVRALQEGGIAQGSAVGKTLLELRRTVEDLDPSAAPRASPAGWTGCPSATRSRTTSASTSPRSRSSTGSCTACATARTS